MKKICIWILIIVMLFTACLKTDAMPEDFAFSVTWGTYGISSYDSTTGTLIKTNDASQPENYITTYTLHESELQKIYDMLTELDLEEYPECYDPCNDPDSDEEVYAEPHQSWRLTVHMNGDEIVIDCPVVATYQGYNKSAQAFINVVLYLKDMLTATEEWEALPEYENFYE